MDTREEARTRGPDDLQDWLIERVLREALAEQAKIAVGLSAEV